MNSRVGKVLAYLLLLGISGVVFFDAVSALMTVVPNPFGVAGMGVGIAAIAVMGITSHELVSINPTTVTFAIVVALLYRLFLYIFQQGVAGALRVPPYLPAVWFTVVSAFGSGLLIGVGFPFLVFLLVSEGFRFLGELED